MLTDVRSRLLIRLLAIAAVFGAGAYFAGCEYNVTANPPAISLHVTVTPSRWTMETGSSLELSAKVTGFRSDSTVTWSFRGKTLGDLVSDASGAIYTSPDSIAGTSDTVIIQAISKEDPSKSATCRVVIVPMSVNPPQQATISISPVSATIEPGASQQFTVTVLNANDTTVTWWLSGPGTLSASGLYIAPPSVNGSQKATIRVTLNEDTTVWTAAEVTVQPPAVPCFWQDTKQILGSYCTAVTGGRGCHNATERAEGYDLTRSSDILRMARSSERGTSKLLSVLRAGGDDAMPPYGYPKLSADQIATIKKWVDAGMDTTPCTGGGTVGCDTTGVRYAVFVRATIQNACLGCHTGSNSTGKYDLSTYSGVAAVAHTGQLVGSIDHQYPYRAMPDGGAKLDDCTIAKIRAWVNQGAPNN